jgi:nucleotide-binding universal stress UspA family protein
MARRWTPWVETARGHDMKIKRILVPVDFSAHSLAALDYAIDLVKRPSPEIVLLYCLEPIQFAAYGAPGGTSVASLVAEQRRLAAASLAKAAAALDKRGVRVRTMIREGSPRRRIIDTAKTVAADLIVMSTHGRTGLARFMIGSVAEAVVRHAHCPVLLVRGPTTKKRTAARRRQARTRR